MEAVLVIAIVLGLWGWIRWWRSDTHKLGVEFGKLLRYDHDVVAESSTSEEGVTRHQLTLVENVRGSGRALVRQEPLAVAWKEDVHLGENYHIIYGVRIPEVVEITRVTFRPEKEHCGLVQHIWDRLVRKYWVLHPDMQPGKDGW